MVVTSLTGDSDGSSFQRPVMGQRSGQLSLRSLLQADVVVRTGLPKVVGNIQQTHPNINLLSAILMQLQVRPNCALDTAEAGY